MLIVSGFMLINEFGGKFVKGKGTGLEVRLERKPYIIQLERYFGAVPRFDEWFSNIVAALRVDNVMFEPGIKRY